MFDMREIGKKIAERRKAMDMTQTELADEIGVSFQAVSNWERGQSMPDIAKLPELAALLHFSIDDLLTRGGPGDEQMSAKLVERIVEGDAAEYVQEERIPPKVIADVAPILKPKQAETLWEASVEAEAEEGNAFCLRDLTPIAPFVSDEFLHDWVMKASADSEISDLVSLAPFLGDETLNELVGKFTRGDGKVDIHGMISLAPFLSEEALDTLVNRFAQDAGEINISALTSLAPFLSDEALDALADRLSQGADRLDIKPLVSLAPFLSDSALDKLVKKLAQNDGEIDINALVSFAPFLSDSSLDALADRIADTASPKELAKLAPFLSSNAIKRSVDKIIAKHGVGELKHIAPFL